MLRSLTLAGTVRGGGAFKTDPLWGHGGIDKTAIRMTDIIEGWRMDCLPS